MSMLWTKVKKNNAHSNVFWRRDRRQKKNCAPEKAREHRAVLHVVRLPHMELILSVPMVTMVVMMVMMTMIGSPKRRSRHHQ